MSNQSGRLGVGIIGAGRVGPILGAALAGAGHAIVGVAAISQKSRDRAHAILPHVPVLSVPDVVERSELVILAVPDAELPSLIEGLASTGVWQSGQLVWHTAAAYGTQVLVPAVRAGVIPLAIHPAVTFTGTSVDIHRLKGAFFAVTTPVPVQPIGQALVVEMGGEPVLIAEEDRSRYAEAIETVSNFSSTIVHQVTSTLDEIGVAQPGQFIAPLVRAAVENALAHPPSNGDKGGQVMARNNGDKGGTVTRD